QKVRTPPPKPVPGAIAHGSDDWLNYQTGHRSGQPKDRDLVRVRAKVGVDRAHIRELKTPPELDAHEAEAHVPDLPEAQTRPFHSRSSGSISSQGSQQTSRASSSSLGPIRRRLPPRRPNGRRELSSRAA